MVKLDNFVDMMTGHFNNKEQFDKMQKDGKIYPYAEHINTICNEKILNMSYSGKELTSSDTFMFTFSSMAGKFIIPFM